MGLSIGNSFLMQPPLLFGRMVQNGWPNNPGGQNSGDFAFNSAIPKKASGARGTNFDQARLLAAGKNPTAEFEAFKAQQYSKILSHEQAHASAAGSLGGGIHIEYDSNGVAVAGHVPLSIPGLNRQNPEQSYINYSTARNAALAPGDPSGQDLAVASTAQSLMGQAQVLMAQKRQAQNAGVSPEMFEKFGRNLRASE